MEGEDLGSNADRNDKLFANIKGLKYRAKEKEPSYLHKNTKCLCPQVSY